MLTDFERKLVDLVERGEPLLGPGKIDAGVIRDILLGRVADTPDPHGVHLRDVQIVGRIDLANVTSTMPIWFEKCELTHGVDASYADLGPVRMTRCRMAHATEPAFNGRQLRTPTLLLTGSTVSGELSLQEARIGGLLDLDRVTLSSARRPALNGTGMHVAGTMLARYGAMTGHGRIGAVCLRYATIDGGAEFDGSKLRNDTGPAFVAGLLQVTGPLNLRNGFSAVGKGKSEAVRLIDARLGSLDCTAATLRNESGPALSLHAARITSDVGLCNGFKATGTSYGVSLREARIDGELNCSQGTFVSTAGAGLEATQAQIAGSGYFMNGFSATGAGLIGAVALHNARIGTLQFDQATIRNTSGPAISAPSVAVGGFVLFRNAFVAEGAGVSGAIDLMDAEIGGAFDLMDATITNTSGPAIRAFAMHLGGPLTLLGRVATAGAFVLTDARIEGAVRFIDSRVHNGAGPALQMRQTRIRQSLEFNAFHATGGFDTVTLDLAQVEVGGAITITPDCVEAWRGFRVTLDVDGLTYVGLPNGITSTEWLELLRTAMPRYAAQPYQQLAAAERAAGHDRRVRRVLMAQRRDQIDKGALTGTAERLWARFSGVALGYGYQPWRALVGLFLVLSLAGLAAGFLGGWGGLTKVGGGACALVDRIGHGLDAGTPLITPKAKCETTNTPWGTVLTISGWVFKVLAWAFATLFIAGFTGAVRKT